MSQGRGGSRGGARRATPPPPLPALFLETSEARRAEKIFLETASRPRFLSKALNDRPTPPPPLSLLPLSQGLDLALQGKRGRDSWQ